MESSTKTSDDFYDGLLVCLQLTEKIYKKKLIIKISSALNSQGDIYQKKERNELFLFYYIAEEDLTITLKVSLKFWLQ